MLNSQNHTTSIHKNQLLTLSIHHRLPFQACRSLSYTSPIFQHSQFSQITKWTDAFAVDLDKYLILLENVHQAVL